MLALLRQTRLTSPLTVRFVTGRTQIAMCADWCATNLRDCQSWKEEGLEMTTTSNEAVKMFDASLRQLVSWINCDQLGGIEKTLSKMTAADPEAIMGHVLTLGLNALGTGKSLYRDVDYVKNLEDMVKNAEKKGNKREKLHAQAVMHFAKGEMNSACVLWERILAEHPNDLLALKFAHDGYFFLGDKYNKRDSVARVIDKWDKNAPCYSYLHGMYAFGLEECGEYEESEKQGRMALELQPQDCWATHAVAHCYEMSSQYNEGIKFMESTVKDWSPCFMLACHNYWHTALFYIEKGDYESALALFDREVDKRYASSGHMLDMVDAASLLFRLELEGVKVGDRWLSLFERIKGHVDDQALGFNEAHMTMVFTQVGSEEFVDLHREATERFLSGNSRGDQYHVIKCITQPIGEAIVAFGKGDYNTAAEVMYPLRHCVYQMGGSHAQRDIFTLILIHACIRSEDPAKKAWLCDVLEERRRLKTDSTLIERLSTMYKEAHIEDVLKHSYSGNVSMYV
uniref:Tetratricopeptide repeat protein 38 n=1 Tax=Steinernema glaseri TaxID=37863 RepID=A0A1I7ZUJ3_9BILA